MSDENTQGTQDTQDTPVARFAIFRFEFQPKFNVAVPVAVAVVTPPTEPIAGLEYFDSEPEVIDPDGWNVERKILRWWSTTSGADQFGPGMWGVARIPNDEPDSWIDPLNLKRYEVTQPRPEIRY